MRREARVTAVKPDVSVLIPAYNEGRKIAPTIQAIARARTTGARVEFIVVDDASTDDCLGHLSAATDWLLEEPGIDVRVCRLERRSGNYRARNEAAALASADVLFITDAHVRFCMGWDEILFTHVSDDTILAGTVTQEGSPFKGYGCTLLIPLMGTTWVSGSFEGSAHVPVSVCAATVIPRALFQRLGGYDEGMLLYGGGEPEFSVRAWLQGAQIRSVAALEVQHEFKPRSEFLQFIEGVRLERVHNGLRFGLLYLSQLGCLQLLRFYARAHAAVFDAALKMIDASDVFERRALLETRHTRPFEWLVEAFALKNQVGGAIL
jgi:glycosyltransferase involved in cell wall biosynthesis